MGRIVVSCPLPGDALRLLEREHAVEVCEDSRGFLAALTSSDAALSMLTDRVDGDVLRSATRLRVVGNCAVGYDNIDIPVARERGIVVVNTPNVLTAATADFAWALLLGASRRVVEADRFVREGRFSGWRLELLLGQELAGQTMGIVGLGRIGAAVAKRAVGFGLRVLYTQRTRASSELERELGAELVGFHEMLERSDFVSIHVPLSEATHHLLDQNALARLKPNAIVVNTSRGAVIDEAALADALRERRIAGAGLDVFEREPEIHPGLLELNNVVLAPHIASATEATRAKMARAVAEDILRVLRGEAPRERVV